MDFKMNKKWVIALLFSGISFNTFSSTFFNIPLAKQCYSIYQKLRELKEVQKIPQCIHYLNTAMDYTESAALDISNDESSAPYELDSAIISLKRAQVYSCEKEVEIAKEEQNLLSIKTQYLNQWILKN